MCHLLTGKDSWPAILQMGGGRRARPAGPLAEAGYGGVDLRPAQGPISSMPAFVLSAPQAGEFIFH